MSIEVTVVDNRGGHDGAHNGGHFGHYTKLVYVPKEGHENTAVTIVSDIDKGEYDGGNQINYHQTHRETILKVDPGAVEWACIMDGFSTQKTMGWGHQNKEEYIPIEGITAGPLCELKKFKEEYREWVRTNNMPAGQWVIQTLKYLGFSHEANLASFAARKTAKKKADEAWKTVATEIELDCSWPFTGTGVWSAPIKIALEIQKVYGQALKGRGYRWQGQRPVYPKIPPKGIRIIPERDVDWIGFGHFAEKLSEIISGL